MSKGKENAPVYEGEQSGTKRLPVPDEMVCICRFLLHCLYTAVKKKQTKKQKNVSSNVFFYIHSRHFSTRKHLEFIGPNLSSLDGPNKW